MTATLTLPIQPSSGVVTPASGKAVEFLDTDSDPLGLLAIKRSDGSVVTMGSGGTPTSLTLQQQGSYQITTPSSGNATMYVDAQAGDGHGYPACMRPDGSVIYPGLPQGQAISSDRLAVLGWYGATQTAAGFGLSTGGAPGGLCFDGHTMWVSVPSVPAVLGLGSPSTYGSPVSLTAAGISNPGAMCFDGLHLWICNSLANTISCWSFASGTDIADVTTGALPVACCFDGANIWVCNQTDNTVTKINAATQTVVGTYGTGNLPIAVVYDGHGHIWIPNQTDQSLTVLDANSGGTVNIISLNWTPNGLVYDGLQMWVILQFSSMMNLRPVSLAGALGTALAVNSTPQVLGYDGTSLWATNDENTLSVLSKGGTTLVNQTLVGTSTPAPNALCWDGAHMWMADPANNQVVPL